MNHYETINSYFKLMMTNIIFFKDIFRLGKIQCNKLLIITCESKAINR